MTNKNGLWYLCNKCDKQHGKTIMWVKHKPENHKDTNKRTSKDAPSKLTVKRNLKIVMQTAKTKEEVEAVWTKFVLN